MAKFWVVDGRTLAKRIKTCGLPYVHEDIKDNGANYWECPQCNYRIDICNWPGLPSGVKFDPSDIELLDYLAAKCGVGNERPHEHIDVFIPTIDAEQGICYKHPEHLPGARKDGITFHLFYRTTNAYAKGHQKRRKICDISSLENNVRWHKTGKTKAIFKNGVQVGCKKILVLYGTVVGGSKPCKTNWIMHQYHLGTNEDEKDDEYVVAKVYYQVQKETHENINVRVVDDQDLDPRTPMINACDPLGPEKTPLYEDVACDNVVDNVVESPAQDELNIPAGGDDSKSFSREDNVDDPSGSKLCTNNVAGAATDYLENLDLGSPSYVNLADLYFPCDEDSFSGWLDW
ncbi:NAC domain-containing protein 73-like [Bidens hawaiensis]|uniref:NAC domain-containing protein 73-like n=1 Tax=Bidens hawaiensis TaxID=980011 RepID=UPI00404A1428